MACSQIVASKVSESKTNAKHKPDSEPAKDNFCGAMAMTWHFWFLNVTLGLCIWLWLRAPATPILPRYQVANRFNAKIDVQDALSKLTTCLLNNIPDRNATIADFTTCLRDMGVNNTHEG